MRRVIDTDWEERLTVDEESLGADLGPLDRWRCGEEWRGGE